MLGKSHYSLYISCCSGVCYFLSVINSNLRPICHRFWNTVSYSLELFIENCGQIAADGGMVTIDNLYKNATTPSDSTIAYPLWLTV